MAIGQTDAIITNPQLFSSKSLHPISFSPNLNPFISQSRPINLTKPQDLSTPQTPQTPPPSHSNLALFNLFSPIPSPSLVHRPNPNQAMNVWKYRQYGTVGTPLPPHGMLR